MEKALEEAGIIDEYGDIKRSKSDDGERTFSYDELVAKGDIKGVVIKKNQQVKLTADGEVDVVSLMKEIHEKCEKIETKSKEPTYYIEVPDISRNVVIARKGVEHGFIKNLLSNGAKFPPTEKLNATVSLELPEILKNSIEVNLSFRDRSADVPYTHVMLGTVAMENEDGTVDYYAVRMMVEEKINQGAILTEANILGKLKAINTKKVGLPQARVIEDDVALTSSKSYAYSVADLLEDVKSEFNDTFSLDVYEKLGMKRHENEFSDNLLYSKSDTDVKYFPHGEKPRRAIDVPSEIDGEKVRRFARTAAEAPAVSDEIAENVVSEKINEAREGLSFESSFIFKLTILFFYDRMIVKKNRLFSALTKGEIV